MEDRLNELVWGSELVDSLSIVGTNLKYKGYIKNGILMINYFFLLEQPEMNNFVTSKIDI